MSKLMSVVKEPVRSLSRLGGDSPLTTGKQKEAEQDYRQLETDVYQRGFQIKRDGLQAQIRYRSAGQYVWVILPESTAAGCLMS